MLNLLSKLIIFSVECYYSFQDSFSYEFWCLFFKPFTTVYVWALSFWSNTNTNRSVTIFGFTKVIPTIFCCNAFYNIAKTFKPLPLLVIKTIGGCFLIEYAWSIAVAIFRLLTWNLIHLTVVIMLVLILSKLLFFSPAIKYHFIL